MNPDRKKQQGGAHLGKTSQPSNVKKKKAPKSPRTPMERVLRILFIVITALAALIVVLYIVYRLLVVKPALPPAKPTQNPDLPQVSGTLVVDGPDTNTGDRKEDFFTFLVIGRDTGGGGNTDTIMLVAYDVPNQKLNVMNIPRDTMVNVAWDIKRINSVYNYYGGGDDGIDALYTEVSQLVGFRPDYNIVVEWEGFGKLVEAIGGVDFYVPFRMYYRDPTQDLLIDLKKGQQTLTGQQAMQLIRYRKGMPGTGEGYVDGDIGRIKMQQDFLRVTLEQCLKADKIIKNIGKYAEIFTECVETDLSVNNLAWFAQQAVLGGLSMENVSFITMPGNYNASAWSRSYSNYQSYVTPSGDELVQVVNDNFNPYLANRTRSQLDIMSVNRDGSLSSSTGRLEDSRASRPSSSSSGASSSKPAASETPVVSPTPEPEDLPTESTTPGEGGGTQTPDISQNPNASPAPGTSQSPSTPKPSQGTETTPPVENPTTPPTQAPSEVPTDPPIATQVPSEVPAITTAPTQVPSEVPAATTAPTQAPIVVPTPDGSGVILPPEA